MSPSNNKKSQKVKVNLTSRDGRSIKVEGSKSDVLDILVELGFSAGIVNTNQPTPSAPKSSSKKQIDSHINPEFADITIKERIKIIIKSLSKDSTVWFSSKDVLAKYEQHIGEKVPLSTISTNLSRFEKDDKILQRRGHKKDLEYSLISKEVLASVPYYDQIERKFM